MSSGVETKRMIPTDELLDVFIRYVKNGTHRVESKRESDKKWLNMLSRGVINDVLPKGFTRQDYDRFVYENFEPIVHNYHYTFSDDCYAPVNFSVTKIKRTYGFLRQDTGERCNFTIIKNKLQGGFTFKLQPLDYFNLPRWVGE